MAKYSRLIVTLILAMALGTAFAQGSVDWRQAEGTQLFLGMNKHAYTDALEQFIPEFEALTGIDVIFEVYSQDEFMTKRLIDLSSGAGAFDVVMMDQAVVQYGRAGWIEPLENLFNNPDLIDLEAYDIDDFFPGMYAIGTVDGVQYSVPISGETQILYYRKDILEAAGIPVPTTMDELYEAAVALNRPGEMAGILLRGQKIHTAWNSSGFVWAYGGRISNDPVNPTEAAFNSPEAVAAISMYAKLLQDAGPAGAGNYTWYEAVADFQQGKAAMYLDASVFMGDIEDPSKSQVAGLVGYAPMPAGPAGRFANVGSWMLSISSASKNKTGAFLFFAWATGKETSLKIGAAAGLGARASVFASPELHAKYPADWAENTLISMMSENPEPRMPRITAIDEWLDTYGGAVNATILGTPAQRALDEGVAKMNEILRRSE